MQILARTLHVAHGCPPRQYAVTFRQGAERRVSIVCGGVRREYAFSGHGYRPGSKAHLERLIALFDAAVPDPSVERINDELRAASEKRPTLRAAPAAARSRPPPADRQLPASDRA
jgi:hypothetical protein